VCSVTISEWACLVTETCPESFLANIMTETSKRMHISDEVLCILQDNECKLLIFVRVNVVVIVI
jgi:hypothetical protein